MIETDVTRALDAAGIVYELRLHEHPVFTVEEAAEARGVPQRQIVKVMLVRLSGASFVGVLIPGDRHLDLSRLRRILGVRRLRLASPEEIAGLGLKMGAISPLHLRHLPLFADAALEKLGVVSMSSGSPEAGLVLRAADLFSVLDVQMVDLIQEGSARRS
jgi:prolyl-tRNA editing enzyme YbaK/EbsC (Cys-tRNA(Pro) deacylase)